MSTAAARAVPVASGPAAQPARLVLLIGLCSAGLVAALLLVAARVPSETLADRLLRAASETRAGTYTQELQAHLDERLRLAGLLLLALAIGQVLARSPEAAARVFVVTPTGGTPRLDGWGDARPVERFATSELFELER